MREAYPLTKVDETLAQLTGAKIDIIKEELSKPTILALCDPAALTKVSADVSAYVWSGSSATATSQWILEACCLCLLFYDRDRTSICPD